MIGVSRRWRDPALFRLRSTEPPLASRPMRVTISNAWGPVLRTAPAVAAPAVRQRWPWRRRSGGWASLAL